MANLVIDIGNSFTKIAVFSFSELIWTKSYVDIDNQLIDDVLNDFKPLKAILSTVKKQHTETWEAYLSTRLQVVKFKATMAKSIKNHYRTPQTLGADRLAAVAGARALYPGSSNMVIDAGTCITYDWVDKEGNYFGGSISPGLNMRYKALNYYTAALPLLEADMQFNANSGDDTQTAIRSGVQNGIRFEVDGFIQSYFNTGAPMNILLTGGDSIFLILY